MNIKLNNLYNIIAIGLDIYTDRYIIKKKMLPYQVYFKVKMLYFYTENFIINNF